MKKNNTMLNTDIYIHHIKNILVQEGLVLRKNEAEFKLFSKKDEYNICYIVKTKNKNLFVKLTSRKSDSEIVDSVSRYLFEQGLNVIPFIKSGLRVTINDTILRLDISEYFNSRKYNYSLEDFVSFLNVIEPIHAALADFPQKEQIRQKSIIFTEKLNSTRERVLLSLGKNSYKSFGAFAEWLRQNQNFIVNIMEKANIRMYDFIDSQCVHGDLHIDNILYNKMGTPFIIDFDESTKVFAPVSYDIAYIVFRFCILPGKTDKLDRFNFYKRLNPSLNIVKDVYQHKMIAIEDIFDLIQTISVKLILIVLFNFLEYGLIFPLSELEKFKSHYQLIEKIKSL